MVAHAASGLVHGPQSPLVETKRTCARIAASDASVLLTGETGTGKEILARAIPHSKLVMIPNASHIFFTDQPEASRAAILSFLAS